TQGKNTLVDTADYDWLNQWNWCASENQQGIYAACRMNGVKILMHRFIMECKPGEDTDHRNLDRLDNRRDNLRKCTRAQNLCNKGLRADNKSGMKGASWIKNRNKWLSQIQVAGHCKFLGYFDTKEDA